MVGVGVEVAIGAAVFAKRNVDVDGDFRVHALGTFNHSFWLCLNHQRKICLYDVNDLCKPCNAVFDLQRAL